MKVACIQMVSTTVIADNLAAARALVQEAASHGSELVVLPEYFCALPRNESERLQFSETFQRGPIQEFLSEIASENGIWLSAGTIPIKSGEPTRSYNSTLVYNPQGTCIARYDKVHLFRFDNGTESYDEAKTIFPGEQPITFDLPSKDGNTWRIGLSICYDLRFPEFYRHYSTAGAHILLVPAAFTHTTGQAHWELLLRARAVENLCFVGASGQGGIHENGRSTWGQTMWIDPWGHILNQQAQNSGVVMADLDLSTLTALRKQLPALNHRAF